MSTVLCAQDGSFSISFRFGYSLVAVAKGFPSGEAGCGTKWSRLMRVWEHLCIALHFLQNRFCSPALIRPSVRTGAPSPRGRCWDCAKPLAFPRGKVAASEAKQTDEGLGALMHRFALSSKPVLLPCPHPPQCAHWGTFPQGKALGGQSRPPLQKPDRKLCLRSGFYVILPGRAGRR